MSRAGLSQTRPKNVSEDTLISDANVLWVDWDGPADPMNPKKWVMSLLFVKLAMTRRHNLAGHTARNGLPPLSCLLSHLSALSPHL